MTAMVPTASIHYPIRPLPNDAPKGSLRIVIWDRFSEYSATGSQWVGPYADGTWDRISGRFISRVPMTEARWEPDGLNFDSFTRGYNAWQVDPQHADFRELIRAVEIYMREHGLITERHRDLPTEQQALDAKLVAVVGWNDGAHR